MSGEDSIEEDSFRVESSSNKGSVRCGEIEIGMAKISGGVGTGKPVLRFCCGAKQVWKSNAYRLAAGRLPQSFA